MKSKSMIAGIVMGVGATAAGMFIKHYSDNKKLKVDKLKEKARKYDELECGQYLSNEEFVNSFYMLEKYLNEQDKSETQYIMQELQEAREFFSNGHFIYETIIFILNL
jgi:gas vesicle protein